jgi:hypothetical protein
MRPALADTARRLLDRHDVAAPADGKFLAFDAKGFAFERLPAGLEAAVAVARDGRELGACDRALFDRGLVRLDDETEAPAALYLRSDRIRDVNALGGRSGDVVAMSNLGHNAGFANQLFQYAFLKLYGLRHNAAIATPAWIGETVYGVPQRRTSRPLPMRKGDEWSVRDLDLWERDRAPVNVDFWGYYQNVPARWRQHRAFLRRLFEPLPPWRGAIERWLALNVPPGASLVAIHLRRGDYRTLSAQKPWFRLIPEEWYLRWLDSIWPSLANPVLFVASDERDAVLPAFRRFAPLTAAAAEAEMPEPRLLADLEIMARADALAICNSSFSRMAALLADPAQRCFIPAPATGTFEPYDPWASDHFWQRFGAPEPRPRSRLPRFLRRRAP